MRRPRHQVTTAAFDILLIAIVFFAGAVFIGAVVDATELKNTPQAIGALIGSAIGLVTVAFAGLLAASSAIRSKQHEHQLSLQRALEDRNHERAAVARAIMAEIRSVLEDLESTRLAVERSQATTDAQWEAQIEYLIAGLPPENPIFSSNLQKLGLLANSSEAISSFYTTLSVNRRKSERWKVIPQGFTTEMRRERRDLLLARYVLVDARGKMAIEKLNLDAQSSA